MAGFNFGSKNKNKNKLSKSTSPPEKVGIMVGRNQIVTLAIPFQTPRAKEIREAVHLKVLNEDGQRIFYFNDKDQSWSNVHLRSTASEPLLSAPPVFAIEKAHSVLSQTAAVASVTIVDEHEQPLTMEQACAMDFLPLEELAADEGDEENDEIASAVLDLQGTAEQHTAELSKLNTAIGELGAVAAKLGRAEAEIKRLGTEVAELKSMMQSSAASPVATEAKKRDVVTAAPAAASSAKTKLTGRLAAAAAKKRDLAAAPTAATSAQKQPQGHVAEPVDTATPRPAKAARRGK